MRPWYKVVTLREEVGEGRSFSPDEFAHRIGAVAERDRAPGLQRSGAVLLAHMVLRVR